MRAQTKVKLKSSAANAIRAARVHAFQLSDDSVGYLVRRTFRAFTHALELRLKEHDVSISMWFFLRLLWERDGLTQKELSQELSLSQPSTVSAMDNLERRGLIARHRSTADRRKINIFLTQAGHDLKFKLAHHASDVNELALTDFRADEVELLHSMLLRMNKSLARPN
jgi:DNA-binding MarR family transcriptional regulator